MHKAVVEAARFIASHAEEPIGLEDIADHVGYSPFHLARSFRDQLGVPPGQFLAAHRFQRAKDLLLSGDDRIIDICVAVGFSSVGTFTARFTEAVGMTPKEFRRLPHMLADAPPRPVLIPGNAPKGGVVAGTVRLSQAASAVFGDSASIYVGLFRHRAPRGLPATGALLAGTRDFVLRDVAPGTYWLLSSALPAGSNPLTQLLPAQSAIGASPRPVRVTSTEWSHQRDVHIDLAQDWSPPVLVALPSLASPGAQDWRSTQGSRRLR